MKDFIAGKQFLVVDDQDPVRQLISRTLKQLGAKNVLVASNGLTALSILETMPIDFVVSDWNMPKMNGVELLKEVRKNDNWKDIPFLMITAETDRRSVMDVISAGVTDFLVKPFNAKALREKVDRCFCFGDPELMAEHQTQSETSAAEKPELQKPTILVVDDMPSNIDVLVNLFQKDYRVKVASSGEQALKICSASAPDLILLDIMMPPGMNGFEVCEQLQQNPDTQGIPVIFLTSRDTAVDMEHGFAVGGVDYVVKPSEPSIVKARVKNHLKLKATRDTAALELDLMMENARLKEEMQYMMRHDLKNPLMGMMYYLTELSEDKSLSDKAQDNILSAESAAYRMLALINSSQDMVKIEKGVYQLHPKKVDLKQVLQRAEKDLNSLLNEKNVSIDYSFDDSCLVMGEELLCYVMLANLLKNAVEASQHNDTLSIHCTQHNDHLKVDIMNSGEVPEAIRKTFFDKYTSANKVKGSGIGTYSARLMSKVQKGDISVDFSEKGKTKVTLLMPLSK